MNRVRVPTTHNASLSSRELHQVDPFAPFTAAPPHDGSEPGHVRAWDVRYTQAGHHLPFHAASTLGCDGGEEGIPTSKIRLACPGRHVRRVP